MESHKIHFPNHQPEYLAINEKDNVIVIVIMMMRSLRFAGAKSILRIIPVVETASNSFRRNRYNLLNMTSSFCGPWFDRLQQARISEISNKRDSLSAKNLRTLPPMPSPETLALHRLHPVQQRAINGRGIIRRANEDGVRP
jgi:hypothetical protein